MQGELLEDQEKKALLDSNKHLSVASFHDGLKEVGFFFSFLKRGRIKCVI